MKLNDNAMYAILVIGVVFIIGIVANIEDNRPQKYRPVIVKGDIISINEDGTYNNIIIEVDNVLDKDENVINFLLGTHQKTFKSKEYDFSIGDEITLTVDIPIVYDYNNIKNNNE